MGPEPIGFKFDFIYKAFSSSSYEMLKPDIKTLYEGGVITEAPEPF